MAGAMVYVHEVHDLVGGKVDEFADAYRRQWRPLLEDSGGARLLWFWHVAHGTGQSYQAVSVTAVRDWATWGALVARHATDPRCRDWDRRGWGPPPRGSGEGPPPRPRAAPGGGR